MLLLPVIIVAECSSVAAVCTIIISPAARSQRVGQVGLPSNGLQHDLPSMRTDCRGRTRWLIQELCRVRRSLNQCTAQHKLALRLHLYCGRGFANPALANDVITESAPLYYLDTIPGASDARGLPYVRNEKFACGQTLLSCHALL